MFTRTTVNAHVTYEVMSKKEREIVTESLEATLEKCGSVDKAELMLSKKHKGCLVSLKGITYEKVTYGLEEEEFYKLAKEIKREELTEDLAE